MWLTTSFFLGFFTCIVVLYLIGTRMKRKASTKSQSNHTVESLQQLLRLVLQVNTIHHAHKLARRGLEED